MTFRIWLHVSDDPLSTYAVVRNLRREGVRVIRCGFGSVDVDGQANPGMLARLRQAFAHLGVRFEVSSVPETITRTTLPAAP